MARTPTPVDIGPWDFAVESILESSSAIKSVRLLVNRPRTLSVWEIHSVRATWSEDGTGDLASYAIADGGVNDIAISNNDETLMTLRNNRDPAVPEPNVVWHWGRSNQLGAGSGDGTIYLPDKFYWDGEMHGLVQNGAGATLAVLYTVVHRAVEFREADYLKLIERLPPRTITKTLAVF